MTFYKLTIPSFTQYKYAWAELAENANLSNDFPNCSKCGRAIGQHYWLPPHDIIIKQPKKMGDVVGGIIGIDLIVSETFKSKYEESGLTGIEHFIDLNVMQIGTKKVNDNIIPRLFGATIKITNTQVDYKKMKVTWFSKPAKNICDLCCPGGGGAGGIYQTYDKIVIKEETLSNFDFFIPVNFVGNIMVTEKAKEFIATNSFTNIKLTADLEAKHDIFNTD